jgi:hypothetical protein
LCLMWTFVGWETESVWGTLWLNFLSRELPGTSINNTATPLRLTPHTQRQFLFLKDFFQRPALKAVLHIATCNCLGPVRQVIKTIEKCPVALHLPDNLFLICVNRNFDTGLPSQKKLFFFQFFFSKKFFFHFFFFANTNRHGLVAWQNFLSCAGLFL